MPLKKGKLRNTFFSNTFKEQPVSVQLSFKTKRLKALAILDETILINVSFLLNLIPPTRPIFSSEKNNSSNFGISMGLFCLSPSIVTIVSFLAFLIPSKIDADYLKKFLRRNMSLQKFIVMKTYI